MRRVALRPDVGRPDEAKLGAQRSLMDVSRSRLSLAATALQIPSEEDRRTCEDRRVKYQVRQAVALSTRSWNRDDGQPEPCSDSEHPERGKEHAQRVEVRDIARV